MGVRAAVVVLLLFIATVKAGEERVTFWRENFKMACPKSGTWFKKGGETHPVDKQYYELKYDGKAKGLYHCEYQDDAGTDKTKYYFYVKGKACANCYELNATLFWLLLIVDMLGTAFVMMIIYCCTKKKSSAGLNNVSKAPAHSGGRAPPVPSPDYELLSAHTRTQDPYSVVNRMG